MSSKSFGGASQQPPPPHQPSFNWFGAARSALQSVTPGGSNPINSPNPGGQNSQPPTRPLPSARGNAAASHFSIPSIPDSFPVLRDLSATELRKLVEDEGAYRAFFASLDQVKQMNEIRDELRHGNIELARRNLSKESEIGELQNQCRIIRGTELASAREGLQDLQRRARQVNEQCSPISLINRLEGAARELDDESEELHRKLLEGEMEPAEFIQKYRKLRLAYHRRVQLRLAALVSLSSPG